MTLVERILTLWMGASRRGSWVVVIGLIVGAYFAFDYAARTLDINTDTGDMLASSLGFQERAKELNDAFPEAKYGLVVIVKAPIADEAEDFTRVLTARLKKDQERFVRVFSLVEEPFVQANALLYLEERELEEQLAKLTKASAFIEAIAARPTAATLLGQLTKYEGLASQNELGGGTLEAAYKELTAVAEAAMRDEPRPLSWLNVVAPPIDAAHFGGNDDANGSKGYTLRFIHILPNLDLDRIVPAEEAINAINAAIGDLGPAYAGRVETWVTGGPALRGEELSSVLRGILVSLALSVIFVSLLLFIAFRSFYLTLISLTCLVITIILTTAFAAFAVGELNLISTAFTVLLVGLGLDFAIHLLLHVEEGRGAGRSLPDAIRDAAREVGPALALAAPTTAIAFFSFLPTNFDGIAHLGLIAGAGVLIAFVISITFLPAAMALTPNLAVRPTGGYVRKSFRLMDRLAIPAAILTLGLAIYAAKYLPEAHLDADPMALRDPNAPSVQGFNLLFNSEESAPYIVTRLVSSQAEAAAAAAEARTLSVVKDTRILTDFVPVDQDEKLELIEFASAPLLLAIEAPLTSPGNGAAQESLPATGDAFIGALRESPNDAVRSRAASAIEQLLTGGNEARLAAFDAALFQYWPAFLANLKSKLDADYVDESALPETVRRRYVSESGLWRVDMLPAENVRDDRALKRFVSEVERAVPDIAGGAVQSLKAGEEVARAMMKATGAALLAIVLVLIILVRRISVVIFVMAPLLLAMALTVSASVYLGVPFNFANVIVMPLLIGIGVDSGIHLAMRHRRHRKDIESYIDDGSDDNVSGGLYATSTPRAVLFSALTTIASFGGMILLSHRGLSSLGAMLTLSMVITLVAMLVVLPALMQVAGLRADANK